MTCGPVVLTHAPEAARRASIFRCLIDAEDAVSPHA